MSIVPNSQFYDARSNRAAKSSTKQELQFINGMPSRLLLVIEPRSSEFLIESGATVRVLVEHQSTEQAIEVEYLPGGMVVYTSDSGLVEVYQNGRRLPQDNQTRTMANKLSR
jgi:hypothetical protein